MSTIDSGHLEVGDGGQEGPEVPNLAVVGYMMVEAFAQIDKEELDPILSITTKVA